MKKIVLITLLLSLFVFAQEDSDLNFNWDEGLDAEETTSSIDSAEGNLDLDTLPEEGIVGESGDSALEDAQWEELSQEDTASSSLETEDSLEVPLPEVEPSVVQEESQDEYTPGRREGYQETASQSIGYGSGGFEERLNRIYNQFYRESISDEAWKDIAGEKINETYVIQPGDTLWDISVTFFGNGHYWPKVWQLNDEITNPHLISAGYELRFVPGTLSDAPQLNLTQGEEGGGGDVYADNSEASAPVEAIEPVIPPPTKKTRSVVQNLPPSLPILMANRYDEFDSDGFSKKVSRVSKQESIIYLTSYLSGTLPEEEGSGLESELNSRFTTAGLYDTVFIRFKEGVTPRGKYLVYRPGEKIYNSSKDRFGYQIHCSAEVQVQEKVNSKENIYKAVVTKSIYPIQMGEMLIRGELPRGSSENKGSMGSLSGEVLGGDFDSERAFFGNQQVLYLDRGLEDGIQNNSIYMIVKNQNKRNSGTLAKDLKTQIAKIKVIKVDSRVSTAIVLGTKEEVFVGDQFASSSSQVDFGQPTEIQEESYSEDFPESDLDFERDDFIDE